MDVSDIFYFFCSGRVKGESKAPGRTGVRLFIENPRRGVSRKAEGPGGCPRRIGEFGEAGGAKYFFFGTETSTKFSSAQSQSHKIFSEK